MYIEIDAAAKICDCGSNLKNASFTHLYLLKFKPNYELCIPEENRTVVALDVLMVYILHLYSNNFISLWVNIKSYLT